MCRDTNLEEDIQGRWQPIHQAIVQHYEELWWVGASEIVRIGELEASDIDAVVAEEEDIQIDG